MALLRSAAVFLAGSALLGGCGPSGGGAASSQAAASGAPPSASPPTAASDTGASSIVESALPPAPAASAAPAPAPARTAAAASVPPRREPTPAELLRNDPAYVARGHRLDALYQNARERDPTGQVDHEQAAALAELQACPDRACLDRWFSRREAALREYVGN